MESELLLSDLSIVEKRLDKLQREKGSEREKEADKAFRQWARQKDLAARDAAAKDKADGAKLEAKDAAVQRKREKVYRDWLKRLKKGAYYSVTGKAERKRPSKKGITQKRAWSDSPPSPPPVAAASLRRRASCRFCFRAVEVEASAAARSPNAAGGGSAGCWQGIAIQMCFQHVLRYCTSQPCV